MTAYTPAPLANLYPEVDPHQAIPLSATERFALTVSIGVMAYGAVVGDFIIAGVGLALVAIACVVCSQKTQRRIRSQARGRFPSEDWVEYRTASRLNLNLFLPLCIGSIGALIVAGFWYIPPEHATLGGIIIAIVSAATIWFLPGLNPMWSKDEEYFVPEEIYDDEVELPGSELQPDEYVYGTTPSATTSRHRQCP